MALLDDEEALIVCNGYKDEEYIETALYASQLGRKVVLVVEKPSEIPLIAEVARRVGIRPRIGIRVKLVHARRRQVGGLRAATAASSACPSSELVDVDATSCGRSGCSTASSCCTSTWARQISNIRNVKNALREASRFYVEVAQAGRAAQVPGRGRRPGRRLRRLARPTSPRR